ESSGSRPTLRAAALVYEPYGARMSDIKADIERFRGVLLADPATALRTYPGAEKYAGDVSAVKADIERAISLRGQLKTVASEIDKAEKHAHEIRCRSLGYQSPLADGDAAAAGGTSAPFTLVETDGNPDAGIARAKSHLEQALQAVLAAELDRCDQERADGSREAVAAYNVGDAVLAGQDVVG